jgi:hypothetical protein
MHNKHQNRKSAKTHNHKSKSNKRTKHNDRAKHSKRTKKTTHGRAHHPYRWQEQSGGSGCGQIATISEPGLEIKSQITGKSGLVIPGGRALLSGPVMGCNTGNHP